MVASFIIFAKYLSSAVRISFMVGKMAISLNNYEWFSHFTFISDESVARKKVTSIFTSIYYDFYGFDPKRLAIQVFYTAFDKCMWLPFFFELHLKWIKSTSFCNKQEKTLVNYMFLFKEFFIHIFQHLNDLEKDVWRNDRHANMSVMAINQVNL